MKRLSKATALLAAGTFLLSGFFMACTPHGAGGAFDTETPEPEAPEEDDGSPVDGTWDFTVSDTYSIGSSAYANLTDKELTNADAKGVTLALSGSVKWGNGSANDASDFCLWFDKGSAYAAGKEESYSKAHFTLKTDSKATLKIVATGNGSSDTDKRWVAVCDSTKKVLDSGTLTALSSGEADKTLSLSLKKGTYYIYTSGSRIRSLAITNQAFEEKTKTVTNDVDTLGLVAVNATSDDETIATAAVTDAGIVITSKKEGSTVINAAKGETEIAKIKVTVSSTGAITTSIVKYEAFTEDTEEVTNNVATLGLVGASVTSDKDDYVTATLSDDKSKITIKSVAQADAAVTAKITVTDAKSKTVTFTVTEARSGELTLGTITPFQREAPVKGTDYTVDGLNFKAIGDNKDNIELSTSETFDTTETLTSYTATLTDGTKYYVRLKAENDVYAESKAASFTANNGGSVSTGSFDLLTSNLAEIAVGTENKAALEANKTLTSGGLTLTLSAVATGVGTTTGNCTSWCYVSEKGILIKKQAMKLEGLTSGTTLTIVAYQNSTTDRNLEVTIGSTGTTEETAMGTTKGTKTYTKALISDDDIYIGASNEIYIQSITVE